jgi:N-carbamoylputrescine amidase
MNPHVDAATISGRVGLACIQMQPGFGEVASNVAKSVQLVERAANQGANLVVLPELCNTGYVFANREEAFAVAEEIPAGPTVTAWIECAARHRRFTHRSAASA